MIDADIKVGDLLIASGGRNGESLLPVTRITATQVICENGDRFSKETGKRIGDVDSYWSVRAKKATVEVIDRVRLVNRIMRARNGLTKFNVTAENVDAVEALLAAEVKQEA